MGTDAFHAWRVLGWMGLFFPIHQQRLCVGVFRICPAAQLLSLLYIPIPRSLSGPDACSPMHRLRLMASLGTSSPAHPASFLALGYAHSDAVRRVLSSLPRIHSQVRVHPRLLFRYHVLLHACRISFSGLRASIMDMDNPS